MSLDDEKSCSVTDLKGMFGPAVRPVSVDEMNRAIAARGSEAGSPVQDTEAASVDPGTEGGKSE